MLKLLCFDGKLLFLKCIYTASENKCILIIQSNLQHCNAQFMFLSWTGSYKEIYSSFFQSLFRIEWTNLTTFTLGVLRFIIEYFALLILNMFVYSIRLKSNLWDKRASLDNLEIHLSHQTTSQTLVGHQVPTLNIPNYK